MADRMSSRENHDESGFMIMKLQMMQQSQMQMQMQMQLAEMRGK
jgi:hypothetical protein